MGTGDETPAADSASERARHGGLVSSATRDSEPAATQKRSASHIPGLSAEEAAARDRFDAGYTDDGIKASAAARELADEHGIDLATVDGTGKDGTVTKGDVEQAIG